MSHVTAFCNGYVDLPSLININYKHYIVTETCQAVTGWHGDDECKDVIDKCVEGLKQRKFNK